MTAIIAPTPATPLSEVPQTETDNFDQAADTFLAELPTYQTELDALAGNVHNNALAAHERASAAATSASSAQDHATAADSAATLAGAKRWVAGEVFIDAAEGVAIIGSARYSNIDLQSYRRKTAGAGTVDPSADPTNWEPVGGITPSGAQIFTNKTYQGVKEVRVALSGSTIDCRSGNVFTKTATGALTWSFTYVPPAGEVFACVIKLRNGGLGTQTLPSGSTWAYGQVPTFSTSGLDVLGVMTEDGGTSWTWYVMGKAMS